MNVFFIIVLAVIALVLVYGILLYNNLVSLKHNVSKAWANIDVLLKQRHDELPKLVETCKQYMNFEQEALTRVMDARARVSAARATQDIPALGQAEGQLRLGLGNLFAVAEAYPDSRPTAPFCNCKRVITSLENTIADRREFYNESVNLNNVRIEQFPDNIVASAFTFTAFQLLRFNAAETLDPNIKALFG